MEFIAQKLEDILTSLRPLIVDWKDETACRVIDFLNSFPANKDYTINDIKALLDRNFEDGMLICRLFLGYSKDQFTSILKDALGGGSIGISRYKGNPQKFLETLDAIGLLETMRTQINRKPHWSDTLVERLRSGRGSAISGQRRGRDVEDFAEKIVQKVFGDKFDKRCTFTGPRKQAKCDFAITSRVSPCIVIEAKGYGATGSKMTDVIGDIEKIIAAKRPDTSFLFFTDGLTWRERQSDLRTIVDYQNNGDVTRIYTFGMAEQFEVDLQLLKKEYKL
jgi:hypothetical protein